jgi:hypothetical protein
VGVISAQAGTVSGSSLSPKNTFNKALRENKAEIPTLLNS